MKQELQNLLKKNADLAAKAAAGEKALVETIDEEVAPEDETTPSPAAEESAAEPVAEDKPQE